ncbi:MAG: aminotransferase class I/II-fold pyridoxal phosphate-dependent enzyme [bacterium]
MLSKRVLEIPPSGIRKFFDLITGMPDVISLGVGEPDFPTPWHIREDALYSIEKGWTTYTSNWGLLPLREKISEVVYSKYNLSYDPKDEVLITVGVSEAIDLALRAILEPDDEVLIPEPSYVSYKPCVIMASGKPIVIPTKFSNKFRIKPDDIKERLTSKTKAIILCYPNNPTGMTYTKDELFAIANVCKENDIIVISDEIYGLLSYEIEHKPFASFLKDKTIWLSGFSKGYAMTGWRLGYALGCEEIISAMCKIHQYIILCAPIMSQYAGLSALSSNSFIDIKDEFSRRRRLIVDGLNSIGLSCLMPDGAFFVFPSIEKTGLSSDDFSEKLLFSEHVATVPGNIFGECGEGFIRCSYATSTEKIEKAIERMAIFLKKI